MKGKPPLKQSGSSLYAHLTAWTTEREIEFLQGLGGWRYYHCKERETIDPNRRRALFLKYREAIKSRVRWEAIEKDKVIQYLEKALKEVGK